MEAVKELEIASDEQIRKLQCVVLGILSQAEEQKKTIADIKSEADKLIDEQLNAMSYEERLGLLSALKDPAYKAGYGLGMKYHETLSAV